jgi:hypothetical protein
MDPYLEATFWLIEAPRPMIVAGPAALRASNVHARTLLEKSELLDPLRPGRVSLDARGLGLLLAEPSAEQLELLSHLRIEANARWFLLPSSEHSPDRAFQDAWRWAHERPAMRTAPRPGTRHETVDPSGLLSDLEVWALAVRGRGTDTAGLREDARPSAARLRALNGAES